MKNFVEEFKEIIIDWKNNNENNVDLLAINLNKHINNYYFSTENLENIAVVCFDIRDFMNFIIKQELKINSYHSNNKYVIDGVKKIKYIRLNKPELMRGHSFNKIIYTEKATNNKKYYEIIQYLKDVNN